MYKLNRKTDNIFGIIVKKLPRKSIFVIKQILQKQRIINKIVTILLSYGIITITSSTLKEIMVKLIKRFKG